MVPSLLFSSLLHQSLVMRLSPVYPQYTQPLPCHSSSVVIALLISPRCSLHSPSVLTHQFVPAFPFYNSLASTGPRSERFYIIWRYRSYPDFLLVRFFVFPVPFPPPIMKLGQFQYRHASQWNPVLWQRFCDSSEGVLVNGFVHPLLS